MTVNPAAEDPAKRHPHYGKTIARCKVGERIGEGRTSHVFKAYYEPLEKNIAVKILSGDMADFQEVKESFLLEARAIAKLDHENLLRVFDVVEDQGFTCILMEFVPGRTLQEHMKETGALPPKKALRISSEMARGLAAAHAEKVVHRDVKPANVILTQGSGQVKLVDFGLAGPKTLANRAGTPMYMSPEACQGKRIDEKSDVYALGVCLYQMLTGALPAGGKTVKEILACHVSVEAPPPSTVNPKLGTAYDSVLKKLLVKAKGYRPTAQEAADLLAPFLDTTRTEDRKGAGKGRRKKRGSGERRQAAEKSKSVGIVVTIVCVVLTIAVVGFLLSRGDEKATDTGAGSTTPGATGPTPPVVPKTAPPPTPTVDPAAAAAKNAYDEVKTFSRQYPEDFAAQQDRWDEVAEKHKGTPWGDKALTHRKEAADAAERKKASDAGAVRRAELDSKRKEERKDIEEALAMFEFKRAGDMARMHGALSGEDFAVWRKRGKRIGYLADLFTKRIDQGLKDRGNPLAANKVDPALPDVRDLVGADDDGLKWSDGSLTGVIKWRDLKGRDDEIFFNLAKKLISGRSPQDNLFMSILAAEIWSEEGEDNRQSKQYREMIELVDDGGTVTRTVKDYFVKLK